MSAAELFHCLACGSETEFNMDADGGQLCDECWDEKSIAQRAAEDPDFDRRLAKLIADTPPDRSAPASQTSGATQLDGAVFALDAADEVEAVWGERHDVLWAQGEPLMIAGPDGVGKTTLGQRVALHRAGIGGDSLLGLPIAKSAKRVLYVAADRPRQAARSMRRMVDEDDRQLLTDRVTVWRGGLPFDLVKEPKKLATWIASFGSDTAIIDCLKDVAPDLSREETGTAVNAAMQACMTAGIELVILHHQRKAQGENKRPNTLADIYGSRWLTAGCGSVLLLWGEAGDPIVELLHLKPADEIVGPLTLITDTRKGSISVQHALSIRDLVAELGNSATTQQVAERIYGTRKPRGAEVEKTRRKLDAAVEAGQLRRVATEDGEPTVYAIAAGGENEHTFRGHGGGHARGHAPSKEGEGASRPPTGFGEDGQGSLVDADPETPELPSSDWQPYRPPATDEDEDDDDEARQR